MRSTARRRASGELSSAFYTYSSDSVPFENPLLSPLFSSIRILWAGVRADSATRPRPRDLTVCKLRPRESRAVNGSLDNSGLRSPDILRRSREERTQSSTDSDAHSRVPRVFDEEYGKCLTRTFRFLPTARSVRFSVSSRRGDRRRNDTPNQYWPALGKHWPTPISSPLCHSHCGFFTLRYSLIHNFFFF